MKISNKLILMMCATFIAGVACKKKTDDASPTPPPSAVAPAETVTLMKKEISATLTKNQDATAAVDLVLPDVNGVNISHLGIADLKQETELRSSDGRSIVTLRSYLDHDLLMAAQSQSDRNDARLYILTLNQKAGNPNSYEVILRGVPLERTNALTKADSIIGEAARVCQYKSASQAFAAASIFFQSNPNATLEQYLESKRNESNLTDDGQCPIFDFGVGPDGKIKMISVEKPEIEASEEDTERRRSRPRSRPRSHRETENRTERPQQEPPPSIHNHQGQAAPPQYQGPAQQQQAPPQYQGPSQQQQAPPQYQGPAQQQQAPPVIDIPQGYHTNWEACYASGYWRTDGNIYCKKKWWSNCSPEEGGKVCKIKSKKKQSEYQEPTPGNYSLDPLSAPVFDQPEVKPQPQSQSQSQNQVLKIGDWMTDFNYCYTTKKWETDANTNCKKMDWPGCTPESGATKCRVHYQ